MRYREPRSAGSRQRERSFDKKWQADAYAARIQRDKYEGLFLDPKRGQVPLRTYAAQWLERQAVGESTHRNYESFLRIHLLPRLGDRTIAGIERADIEILVTALGRELAVSTLHDRMKMVSGLFRSAVRDKRRPDDPTDGVRLPRRAPHALDVDSIPTLHEVDLIAQHIAPHYRLTVYLQAGAGLRISEALAFSADCPRDLYLRVRRQISSKGHRADCTTRFVPLKHRSAKEYRDVPLPPFLAQEIDQHLRQWGTSTVSGHDVLFGPRQRGKGTMPTATTYSYHFRKALRAAGLVRPHGTLMYTPHSLRHFFASTALGHGIPVHEVSRWLGHRSIKTTVDIYGHLVPASWDRCRTIMQAAFRPTGPDSARQDGSSSGDYSSPTGPHISQLALARAGGVPRRFGP
ncbi:tyrosine-type recombinase/integrase [Streptomyces sp. NPDC050095]|uniref:tyrosine-type recombinase/integrase n=1 Tax=unclassified Streptomyces TaxID=2593676 RepID=UPI003428BFEC